MYWDMCYNVPILDTLYCSQFSKIPKSCPLLPGAGAAPKQAGSETLLKTEHLKNFHIKQVLVH